MLDKCLIDHLRLLFLLCRYGGERGERGEGGGEGRGGRYGGKVMKDYFCLYVVIIRFHAGKTGKSYTFQVFIEQKSWIFRYFLENAGKS